MDLDLILTHIHSLIQSTIHSVNQSTSECLLCAKHTAGQIKISALLELIFCRGREMINKQNGNMYSVLDGVSAVEKMKQGERGRGWW